MTKKYLTLALQDIIEGLKAWHIWFLLGWQDIKLRYRRSQLGPFWITLSTAIMIYSMGFLYGKLFKINLAQYYPFIAAGMIIWGLISAIILESNEAFVEAHHFIKQIKLPYSVYILRILTRNFIIFFHNILAVLPILIYFKLVINIKCFLAVITGLLIIAICGFSYGMVLALLGARFRDLKPIIASLVQVLFLLTPIMWQSSMLPAKYKFMADLNPFNELITLVRDPLTGTLPSSYTVIFCFFLMLSGMMLLSLLLWRTRHRIAFWV